MLSTITPLPGRQKLRRELARLGSQARTLVLRPRSLGARRRYVFILGHMRSGSTLLCHLLSDSDDIVGFGEAHHDYRRRSDLARLLLSANTHTGKNSLRYRYVLDKIVSAQHVIGAPVLTDDRTRYVFLIREPLAAIASIVAMRRQFHEELPHQVLAFATHHYRTRLSQIVQAAATIADRRRCLLLTHQQLLHDTPAAFAALQQFLDLSAPLREEYRVTHNTGRPGIGDPSPNIRLGRIVRSLPRKRVDLSVSLRSELEACYESCSQALKDAAQTVADQQSLIRRAAA